MSRIKAVLYFICCILLVFGLFGCSSDENKVKITDINQEANTFKLIDVKSGTEVKYQKIVLDGKEVIKTQCVSSPKAGVAFAFSEDDIKKEGDTLTINGARVIANKAEVKYQLKDGILSIQTTK